MPARAPKDPHAPKKYQSSYFLFSNERRPLLQVENKGMAITEISKLISAEWKLMDTTRKTHYDTLAKQGRAKYEIALSEYKQTSFYREHLARLSQWKSTKVEGGGKFGQKPPKKPKQPISMPKRPQSSYFIFSNERRPELRTIYTDKKVTELSGLISKEWRGKTEAEKKLYEEKANVNKERYHSAMDKYKKTQEYTDYMGILDEWKLEKKRFARGETGDNVSENHDGVTDLKLPKKPKDTSCPKRPLTSYFIFAKENREQTKKEFPSKPITEIAKEISKKWNVLNTEDKEPFNLEAAKLKAVYNEKLKAYKATEQFAEFEVILKEWKAKCDEIKKKNKLGRANQSNNSNNNGSSNSAKKTKNSKNNNAKAGKKSRYYDSDSDSDSDASMSSSASSNSDDSSSGSGSESSGSTSKSYDSDGSAQSSSE